MKAFLQIPAERRRRAFQQVDEAMGLQAFSVEKDFWVCWTLRELFTPPALGEHLTFKGGGIRTTLQPDGTPIVSSINTTTQSFFMISPRESDDARMILASTESGWTGFKRVRLLRGT